MDTQNTPQNNLPATIPAAPVRDVEMSATEIERVLVYNDLKDLTPPQRMNYYRAVCNSLGLNYLTRPFEFISMNNKLTLYARKDATDQLRKIHGVDIDNVDIQQLPDCVFVKAFGHTASGRKDVEIGVVMFTDMQGNKANVLMKAITKAKRRLTLSLCGLGWLDETEIETIPNAKLVRVDDAGVIKYDVTDLPEKGATNAKEIEDELKAGVVKSAKSGRKKFDPDMMKNADAKKMAVMYADFAARVFDLVDKNPADPIITKYRVDFEAVTYDAVKIACEEWGKFVQVFGINKNTMISAGTMKMYDDMNDTSVVVQSFAPFTIKEVLAVYDTSKSLAELPIDATYGEIRETLVAVSMAQEQNK